MSLPENWVTQSVMAFKTKLSYLNMALLGNTLCKTTQDVENQILGL